MKTKLFMVIALMLMKSVVSSAQVSVLPINFDNYVNTSDNDFENYFSGGLNMAQIQNNGINGSGCVTVPDTNNWGNDLAHFCFKYNGTIGNSYTTELFFKYDITNIVVGRFDRAAALWNYPSMDFNHYLITAISHDKKIVFYSYAFTNAPGILANLLHGNWYQLKVTMDFIGGGTGDQINVTAIVNDYGPNGTSVPSVAGSASTVIYDNILIADPAIDVAYSACRKGGTVYVDNFQYSGEKSGDSCIVPSAIHENNSDEGISFSISNHVMNFQNNFPGETISVSILNQLGQEVKKFTFNGIANSVSISDLSNGIYTVSARNKSGRLVKNFSLNN